MVFALALAGSLAKQGTTPASLGTLPTHRPLFVGMVAGVTVILVALTFFPCSRSDRSRKEFTDGCHRNRFRGDSQQPAAAAKGRVQGGLLDPKMLLKATPDAFRKLDPRTLWRNPVMFIVEIGARLDHRARDRRPDRGSHG